MEPYVNPKLVKMENGKINFGISCHIYQVWSRWFLIVGFSTFSCKAKFLCLFHSTKVCIWTLVHVPRILILFHGNICNFNCHLVLAPMPKIIFSHQVNIGERWSCHALDLNGLKHWNSLHDIKNKFITCARISFTLFYVSNVFWITVY